MKLSDAALILLGFGVVGLFAYGLGRRDAEKYKLENQYWRKYSGHLNQTLNYVQNENERISHARERITRIAEMRERTVLNQRDELTQLWSQNQFNIVDNTKSNP